MMSEVRLLHRARVPGWGVPEVFSPRGRVTFPLDGGGRTQAWFAKSWEMAITAYGVLAVRSYWETSEVERYRRGVELATEVVHDAARFNVHLAWNESAGAPWTYVALAAPGHRREDGFAEPGETLLVDGRAVTRTAGVDAYYVQDLAALMAVEAGDEVAARRVRGLDPHYGASMGQLRWWYEEQGLLPGR